MKKQHQLVRDFVWLGTSQLLVLLARLFGIRILTELVTTDTYGELGLLLAVSTLGIAVFANPLIQAAMRALPDSRLAGRAQDLHSLSFQLLTLSVSAFGCLLLAGSLIWIFLSSDSASMWAIGAVAILTVVDVLRTFEIGMLNVAHRQRAFSAWNAIDAWARPLFAIVFVVLAGPIASAVILGYTSATALTYAGFRRLQKARAPAQTDLERSSINAGDWHETTRSAMLRYAFPLVPVALFGWLTGVADRFVLAGLAGTAETGLYIAAYGLASAPLFALTKIFVNTFRPRLYEAHASSDHGEERRLVALWIATFLGVGGFGVLLYFQFAGPIAHVALASTFRESSSLMPWLAMAYLVKGLQSVFETRLYAQKRTHVLLNIEGVGAAVALICYFALIPELGAMGAVWGTFIAMVVTFLATIWLARESDR